MSEAILQPRSEATSVCRIHDGKVFERITVDHTLGFFLKKLIPTFPPNHFINTPSLFVLLSLVSCKSGLDLLFVMIFCWVSFSWMLSFRDGKLANCPGKKV